MALSLTRTTQGTTSDANSNLNNNWTAIENLVNGNLDTTNLKTTTAAITAAQLAAAVQARLNPSGPSTNFVPVWNGSAWVAQKITTSQISATAGILGSQLAAAAAIAPTQLTGGTTGQVLKTVGSTPTWSKAVSVQTNTTSVGTGAATTETNLQTVALGAAALATGDIVRIRAGGTTTGALGTKTVKAYCGATVIANLVLPAGSPDWSINATVVVTGAATQKAIGDVVQSSNIVTALYSAPAETISGAITLKTTGQTTNNSDEITSELLTVEIIPA